MRYVGASTFETNLNNPFLFNVAILPKFQRHSLGSKMLKEIVRQCDKPLYTYSDNPNMRQKILPEIGFESLGSIHLVPLDQYDQRK